MMEKSSEINVEAWRTCVRDHIILALIIDDLTEECALTGKEWKGSGEGVSQ